MVIFLILLFALVIWALYKYSNRKSTKGTTCPRCQTFNTFETSPCGNCGSDRTVRVRKPDDYAPYWQHCLGCKIDVVMSTDCTACGVDLRGLIHHSHARGANDAIVRSFRRK